MTPAVAGSLFESLEWIPDPRRQRGVQRDQPTSLFLGSNRLTGPIPPELGNLTNLTGLHLAKNQLTGPIPPELGNLTNLINISLNNNNLTGSVPPELGNLTALFYFTLEENQLTGCIPRKPESERLRHEPALPLCP